MKTRKAQNDSSVDYYSLESVQNAKNKSSISDVFWILMLVISFVIVLVLAFIAFATKKKLCCFKRTQLAAFKKTDVSAVDEPVDEPEVGKKMDKSQSEFIKSVTGGNAEILNSPNFVLNPTGTRTRNRERIYESRDGEVDQNESDDSSSLNSTVGEPRVRYQSLEFEVHSNLNLRGNKTDYRWVEEISKF